MQLVTIDKDDIDDNVMSIYKQGYDLHTSFRPDLFVKKTKLQLRNSLVAEFDKNTICKIVENNQCIGIMMYYIKLNSFNKKVFWLNEIVLDKKAQNKGYFSLLFDEIIKLANNEKCDSIELNCWAENEHAYQVYEHLGMKIKGVHLEYKL